MNIHEALRERRSIRKFKSTPVSEQDLLDIMEAGVYAPSGVNNQPWYYIAIKNPDDMQALKTLMHETVQRFRPNLEKRFSRNPETIVETESFIGSLGGAPACILVFMLKPEYNGQVSPLQAVSAGIQNMLLEIHAKGLGACWMTAPLEAGIAPEIHKLFAPDKGEMVAMIPVGYPDQTRTAPKRREGRFEIR